jgi:hypothetical protein
LGEKGSSVVEGEKICLQFIEGEERERGSEREKRSVQGVIDERE